MLCAHFRLVCVYVCACVCVFLCKAGQMPKHARVMFLNVDHEDVLIYDVSQEDGSHVVVCGWECVRLCVCMPVVPAFSECVSLMYVVCVPVFVMCVSVPVHAFRSRVLLPRLCYIPPPTHPPTHPPTPNTFPRTPPLSPHAGTVEKLVETLADEHEYNSQYVKEFLLTFRSIMEPMVLMNMLIG